MSETLATFCQMNWTPLRVAAAVFIIIGSYEAGQRFYVWCFHRRRKTEIDYAALTRCLWRDRHYIYEDEPALDVKPKAPGSH